MIQLVPANCRQFVGFNYLARGQFVRQSLDDLLAIVFRPATRLFGVQDVIEPVFLFQSLKPVFRSTS
jgi:uncharacterized membrane protein YciS (DUF1049 family)